MSDITPITREEALLDGQDLTPITRKEQFIKRIYDPTQVIPEPATREEWFLKKAGEGSSPVTIEALSVTENGTYSEAGKAYSPVTVNVPYDFDKKSLTNQLVASFDDAMNAPLYDLDIDIEPVQDLHGYANPWVGGAGKNKIPINCDAHTKQGVTYTVYKNEDGAVTKIHAQGTAIADHSFSVVEGYSASNPFMVKAGSYWFKGLSDGASNKYDFNLRKQGESSDLVQITDKKSLELSEDTYFQSCYLYVYRGANIDTDIYPMIWSQSSPNDDFEPYSNICPISGWTAANVTACGETYNISFGVAGTVYGGTLNVLTGELVVTHANIASYNGETINEPWISSMDVYSAGATPTTGAQVVYPLATPQTYQLTPEEIKTIFDQQNNIYADTGNVANVTYLAVANE